MPSMNKIFFQTHFCILMFCWPCNSVYLLTYSMVQSHSWGANWFAASQEFPRISRNPKVHYRTHKRPPPVSILGQPNPVRIPTSNLLQIHPNIIHPSTLRSPQWSPSLRFPHQDPIHPLSSPIRDKWIYKWSNFITKCQIIFVGGKFFGFILTPAKET